MIDAAGAAVGIIVHSALVGREARPGGVDTDRDRTCGETEALFQSPTSAQTDITQLTDCGNCNLQSCLVAGLDIHEAGHGSANEPLLEMTGHVLQAENKAQNTNIYEIYVRYVDMESVTRDKILFI